MRSILRVNCKAISFATVGRLPCLFKAVSFHISSADTNMDDKIIIAFLSLVFSTAIAIRHFFSLYEVYLYNIEGNVQRKLFFLF